MKYKYVTVDTSTKDGIIKAEKLKAEGYKVQPEGYHSSKIGIDKIMFSIPVK